DLAYSAGILLISLPLVVGAEGAGQIGLIVGAVVLLGLLVLYLLARNRGWALDLFHMLSQRWPVLQRVGERLLGYLSFGMLLFSWSQTR
ncbi:MAG: hypothetical protein ACXWV2_07670, partial [Chitinophagaceae bacterium]